MTPQSIIVAATDLGYEVTMLEGKPYLRFDFYSTTMDEAQDHYYDIVEQLGEHGMFLDDPYIEHDCITGNVQEKIWDVMDAKIDEMITI